MKTHETQTEGWILKILGIGKKFLHATIIAVVILLLPLIIPILAVIAMIFGIGWFFWGMWLGWCVKRSWFPLGKKMLFVYSNSPIWKEYIEANILPKIESRAIVINWSERSNWDWKNKPLELKVFKHWAGVKKYFSKNKTHWDGKEFNPIAITFLPWWKKRVFRFWKPFRDFKHGKEKPLKDLEAKLYEVLEKGC